MPSTMTAITITDPASGISITTAIGMLAATRPWNTLRSPGYSRSPASTRLEMITAMPSTMASLANSAGCTENPPPNWIQECCPLIVEPSGLSVASSIRITAMYRNGTSVRKRRLPVPMTTAQSTSPIIRLVRWR